MKLQKKKSQLFTSATKDKENREGDQSPEHASQNRKKKQKEGNFFPHA